MRAGKQLTKGEGVGQSAQADKDKLTELLHGNADLQELLADALAVKDSLSEELRFKCNDLRLAQEAARQGESSSQRAVFKQASERAKITRELERKLLEAEFELEQSREQEALTQAELQVTELKLAAINEDHQNLKCIWRNMQGQHAAAERHSESLRKQLQGYVKREAQMQETEASLRAAMSSTEQLASAAQHSHIALQAAWQQEKGALQQEKSTLEGEKAALADQNQELAEASAQAERKLNALKTSSLEQEERAVRLQEQVALLQREKAEWQEVQARASASEQERQREQASLQREVEGLRSSKSALEAQVDRLEGEAAALKAAKAASEKELQETKAASKNTQHELKALAAQLTQAQAEAQSVHVQLVEEQARHRELLGQEREKFLAERLRLVEQELRGQLGRARADLAAERITQRAPVAGPLGGATAPGRSHYMRSVPEEPVAGVSEETPQQAAGSSAGVFSSQPRDAAPRGGARKQGHAGKDAGAGAADLKGKGAGRDKTANGAETLTSALPVYEEAVYEGEPGSEEGRQQKAIANVTDPPAAIAAVKQESKVAVVVDSSTEQPAERSKKEAKGVAKRKRAPLAVLAAVPPEETSPPEHSDHSAQTLSRGSQLTSPSRGKTVCEAKQAKSAEEGGGAEPTEEEGEGEGRPKRKKKSSTDQPWWQGTTTAKSSGGILSPGAASSLQSSHEAPQKLPAGKRATKGVLQGEENEAGAADVSDTKLEPTGNPKPNPMPAAWPKEAGGKASKLKAAKKQAASLPSEPEAEERLEEEEEENVPIGVKAAQKGGAAGAASSDSEPVGVAGRGASWKEAAKKPVLKAAQRTQPKREREVERGSRPVEASGSGWVGEKAAAKGKQPLTKGSLHLASRPALPPHSQHSQAAGGAAAPILPAAAKKHPTQQGDELPADPARQMTGQSNQVEMGERVMHPKPPPRTSLSQPSQSTRQGFSRGLLGPAFGSAMEVNPLAALAPRVLGAALLRETGNVPPRRPLPSTTVSQAATAAGKRKLSSQRPPSNVSSLPMSLIWGGTFVPPKLLRASDGGQSSRPVSSSQS